MESYSGTVRYLGERYEYTADPVEGSADLAVYLDLGNGRPEHIGYVRRTGEVAQACYEELVKLSGGDE